MTIEEKQKALLEDFNLFEDWMEKYEYIIELGKELPIIDDSEKIDQNLIKGCQSNVWLTAKKEGDKIRFKADSDAVITKGLIGLIIKVLDNEKPTDVAQADMSFLSKIGLHEHLSPTRSNGLTSMLKQMKLYGIAFSQQD